MAINRIENTAQIISDCLVIDSNTVETIVRIPPTIYKEVDKCEACVGDILTYTITIRNNSLCPLKNIVFNDRIPYGTDLKLMMCLKFHQLMITHYITQYQLLNQWVQL